MPRGSRKKSIDEQIAEAESKVKEYQDKIKDLKAEKEKEDIQKLLDAAKEAGMSPAELVEQLKVQKNSSTSKSE